MLECGVISRKRLLAVSSVVLNFIFRTVGRVRVHGLENLPDSGPAIVAINHASYLDPPLIGAIISRKRLFRGVGKAELFKVPVIGWYLKTCGCFPVERDKNDMRAMRESLATLKSGEVLLMAPEGTRGVGDRKRTPHPGISFIAQLSGAPIIPARLYGTAWPWIPGNIWVRFDKPMRFDPKEAETIGAREAHKAFAERLMNHIYSLSEYGK